MHGHQRPTGHSACASNALDCCPVESGGATAMAVSGRAAVSNRVAGRGGDGLVPLRFKGALWLRDAALLAVTTVILAACQVDTGPSTINPPTPTTEVPQSGAELPAFVALSPRLHARLVPVVAEVRMLEVRQVADLAETDNHGSTRRTAMAGRLVVMEVRRFLKPDSGPSLLIAIVPDSLDPAPLVRGHEPADLYAPGTEALVFFHPYRGPGDRDCADLAAAMERLPSQVRCGFAVPYPIDGANVRDPFSGLELSLTGLEAGVEQDPHLLRPPRLDPPPQPWSYSTIDRIHLTSRDLLALGYSAAEVEVTRVEAPDYNTDSGAAPSGPPNDHGGPHVDRDAWDIRSIVELEIRRVYSGDPAMTDIVTLVPGTPDNPYHPSSGNEPPPLPAGMRGIVVFDERALTANGNPTHQQLRALARVAVLNAAGRRARLLTAWPEAASYFIGPYAIEDDEVRLVPDYRATLADLVR